MCYIIYNFICVSSQYLKQLKNTTVSPFAFPIPQIIRIIKTKECTPGSKRIPTCGTQKTVLFLLSCFANIDNTQQALIIWRKNISLQCMLDCCHFYSTEEKSKQRQLSEFSKEFDLRSLCNLKISSMVLICKEKLFDMLTHIHHKKKSLYTWQGNQRNNH